MRKRSGLSYDSATATKERVIERVRIEEEIWAELRQCDDDEGERQTRESD